MSQDDLSKQHGTNDRGLNNPMGTESRTNVTPALKSAEKAIKMSGVLPETVEKLLGPLDLFLDYGKLVIDAIGRIGRYPYDIGYSEGYARVLTYKAFGRDPELLPYIATGGRYTLYASVEDLPDQPNNEVQKGLGFFKGKEDAIRDLNISDRKRGPEEFLNECFRQIAKGRDVKPTLIPKLQYFADEWILKQFGR